MTEIGRLSYNQRKWARMTPEQKILRNEHRRALYRGRLEHFRNVNRQASWRIRRSDHGRLTTKINSWTNGHAGRRKRYPRNHPFMVAVTGLTTEEFSRRFPRPGVIDHIVTMRAFDLTNPEHLIRCMHISNLRLLPQKRTHLKSDEYHPDIMGLPCNPQALELAVKFIKKPIRRRCVAVPV